MSVSTDDVLKALKKDPVLYFDLIQRVLKGYKEARVVGPWKGPERTYPKGVLSGVLSGGDDGVMYTWWRENPYGHRVAIIRQIRKERTHGDFEYFSVPLNITSRGVDADKRSRKVFEVSGSVPVEKSLTRAKTLCDEALQRNEWELLDSTPMLAGPWYQGSNYMKRDIMRGSRRSEGEDPILCVVRMLNDDTKFSWAVLARDQKRIIRSGKETTQEAACGRVDRILREMGWELA